MFSIPLDAQESLGTIHLSITVSATQEAEAGRLQGQGLPRKLCETLFYKKKYRGLGFTSELECLLCTHKNPGSTQSAK